VAPYSIQCNHYKVADVIHSWFRAILLLFFIFQQCIWVTKPCDQLFRVNEMAVSTLVAYGGYSGVLIVTYLSSSVCNKLKLSNIVVHYVAISIIMVAFNFFMSLHNPNRFTPNYAWMLYLHD